MALATIGLVVGIVGGLTALGSTAYSLSQSGPNLNQGNAQAAGVQAAADILPIQRRYEAAARQGGVAPRWGYSSVTADRYRQMLQNAVQRDNSPDEVAKLQGLLDTAPTGNQLVYFSTSAGSEFNLVPRSQAIVDFRGLGTAEVQGTLAREMAGVQLRLQQKYGTQFAQEARNQLALADPQGTAARDKMYQLLQQEQGVKPDRPVAELLDRQVGEQLASGSQLDPTMRSVLDDEVRKAQAARGQDQGASTQDFATPLETGYEGQARRQAAEQKATGWLSSGATPEDVEYRREQQQMADLGAFVNGQTPEAQFRNLSGAQGGTTPFVPGQPLSQLNNNAGATSQGYTTAGYLQNLRYQQSQANPWMAGLSSILSAAGGAANAGLLGGGAGGGG